MSKFFVRYTYANTTPAGVEGKGRGDHNIELASSEGDLSSAAQSHLVEKMEAVGWLNNSVRVIDVFPVEDSETSVGS